MYQTLELVLRLRKLVHCYPHRVSQADRNSTKQKNHFESMTGVLIYGTMSGRNGPSANLKETDTLTIRI